MTMLLWCLLMMMMMTWLAEGSSLCSVSCYNRSILLHPKKNSLRLEASWLPSLLQAWGSFLSQNLETKKNKFMKFEVHVIQSKRKWQSSFIGWTMRRVGIENITNNRKLLLLKRSRGRPRQKTVNNLTQWHNKKKKTSTNWTDGKYEGPRSVEKHDHQYPYLLALHLMMIIQHW